MKIEEIDKKINIPNKFFSKIRIINKEIGK